MVLQAKDIMDSAFLTFDGDVDALSCARAMVERRKGYAIVTVGGPARATEIVTEWDYLEKIVAPGVDPGLVKLKDIASPVATACRPETPTDEVISTMTKLGVRRMIVRTDDRIMGVITAKNVLATFREYVDKLTAEIAGNQSNQTPLG